MYSDALLPKSCGASRIAYVALQFEELQGFRYAPLWIAWLFLSVFSEFGKLSQSHFKEIYVGSLVVFLAAWIPWIKRWYRLRYGTVLRSRRSDKWCWYPVMGYLLFSIGVSAFRRLKPYEGSLLMLWPMLLVVLPSALHLPPADRAIRLRFALYAGVMLSLLVGIGCGPVLNLSVQAVQAGSSAALLAMSLYDHWLLNHLLRRAHGLFL